MDNKLINFLRELNRKLWTQNNYLKVKIYGQETDSQLQKCLYNTNRMPLPSYWQH